MKNFFTDFFGIGANKKHDELSLKLRDKAMFYSYMLSLSVIIITLIAITIFPENAKDILAGNDSPLANFINGVMFVFSIQVFSYLSFQVYIWRKYR